MTVEGGATTLAPVGRRRAAAIRIVMGLVVVLVAAWLAVGLSPRIGPYGASGVQPDVTWTEDPEAADGGMGVETVDPPGGHVAAWTTLRNDGPVPTVLELPVQPTPSNVAVVLRALDDGRTGNPVGPTGPVLESIVVPSGGTAAVELTIGFLCGPFPAGASLSVTGTAVVARTLGLSREVPVDLSPDVRITTSTATGNGCE